jgi:hypothetical protein
MDAETFLPANSGANYREFFAMLCNMLPPSPGDSPHVRAARERSAMDAVVALHPEDAFEARLAVRAVAMDAQCADALRAAGLAVDDPLEMRRCRAWAASTARQSDTALRALLRIQATREKQLAKMHPAAMGRAGWWFHEAAVPAPKPAEPELTEAQLDREAELYAAMYPDRVARICAAGGLPPDLDFGPPEPYIVAGLLRRAGEASRSTASRQETRLMECANETAA